MKILFLAPQPFFQDRGTPIAVRLAVQVLAERKDDSIDLLTYHEGQDVTIGGVRLMRAKVPSFVRNVGPGLSIKKLVCDVFFFFSLLRLLWTSRKQPYDIIHAVEEAVFMAWIVKFVFGIPYLYDMDSSMAMQVTEKYPILRLFQPVLQFFERLAVRGSTAVVPVCDALALIAEKLGSRETQILRDIHLDPVLLGADPAVAETNELRKEAQIEPNELVVLYVGNLEYYQGIDLLLDSTQKAALTHRDFKVVIIGGTPAHIEKYKLKADSLQITQHVVFLGSRPITKLSSYLEQADILVSPRIAGNNTPMKIYSYLHSGKAVLATDLPTHSQVMHGGVALLTGPTREQYGKGLITLLANTELRETLGNAARELARERYTYPVFQRDLNSLYNKLETNLAAAA